MYKKEMIRLKYRNIYYPFVCVPFSFAFYAFNRQIWIDTTSNITYFYLTKSHYSPLRSFDIGFTRIFH